MRHRANRNDQTRSGAPRDGKRTDRARQRDADRKARRQAKHTIQGRTR